jgi:hypothetical protein
LFMWRWDLAQCCTQTVGHAASKPLTIASVHMTTMLVFGITGHSFCGGHP